jgi:dissimilatory sulfite reductase related protein
LSIRLYCVNKNLKSELTLFLEQINQPVGDLKQMPLEINGKIVEIDNEGYLVNPEEWDEEIAKYFAQQEDVELTDLHWRCVKFIRQVYEEKKIAVDVRFVVKHLAEELGEDKKIARKRLFELFPYGYVKQTCKIAGIKRPRAWSTG